MDWRALRKPELVSGPVRLRPLSRRDFRAWADIMREDEEAFRATQPTWPDDFLIERHFRRRIAAFDRARRSHRGYVFAVLDAGSDRLVGSVQLAPITYGTERRGTLGYWMAKSARRKGWARAAVGAVVTFAFDRLRLERLEAQCLPDNEGSIGLLSALGFHREGTLASYLEIDGERRDHVLFARLA